MAANNESVIIEVDIDAANVAQELSRVTYQMATLKELQKNLKKEIDAGNDSTGELAKQYAQADKELKLLTASQKALTGQLQSSTKAEHEMGDSFREMDAQLRDLENQYKSLTKAQRETEEGQKMKEQIIALKQELKDFDAELGNHQRNVGNYSEAIVDAAGQMGGLGGAIVGATDKMNKAKAIMTIIAAHPLIAILSALVLVLKTIHDAFAANAAAMEKLTGVMGAFSGAANVVNVIVDKIAVHIGVIAEKALALADRLGLLNDDMKESMRIAKEDLAIQEAERDAALQTAEDQRRIAELKAKAQEKDVYSTKERMAMMQEAADLEEGIAKRQYELAKRAYEQQVAKNSLSESSQEDLKKENDLRIAMINAETALFNKQKELNGQMVALRAEALANARENAATRLELERALEDSILELEGDATKKAVTQAQRAGEKEIEALRLKLEKFKNTDTKARELLQKLIVSKEKETQQKVTEILTKATEERERKVREAARAAAEIGVRDTLDLAQMRYDNAVEDYERLQNLTETEIAALYETQEDYQTAVIASQKAFYDAQEALANEKYQREKDRKTNEFEKRKNAAVDDEVELANIEYEQAVYENEQLIKLDEETKNRLFTSQEQYEAAVIASNARVVQSQQKAIEAQRKMAQANTSAIAGMMGSLTNLLDQYGEENEAAAKASKAIALGKVAVETGIAIATGVAQAQSVPFPANIAAIATTVGTVLANIATAISTIKSAKFEHGGVVGGNSYTGDHVLIRANSGEGVYTGKQANNLLQRIANSPLTGSADYEQMAAAMVAAVESQPAPVLVLQELREFENKVATFNEIAEV